MPEDGVINASDLCNAYVLGAKKRGVRFMEGYKLRKVNVEGGVVTSVLISETDFPEELHEIHCNKFANCGGQVCRGDVW